MKTDRANKTNKSKRIRLSKNQRELFEEILRYSLGIVIAGGVLATIIAAPNLLQVLGPLFKKQKIKPHNSDIELSVNKLFKDRFVELYTKDGREYLRVTEKGRRQHIEFNIDTISISQQSWDGKWRIVIFDIPENYRLGRDVLRRKLKEIGFVKVQKSVWVCPYECRDEISFIASTYEVERFVNYIIAESIDAQDYLKRVFGLK